MVRAREQVGEIMEDQRGNALLAWVVLAIIASVAVESVFTNDPLWTGFVLVVLVLCTVPPLAHRDPTVMLPWEVIAIAALPIIGHAFATFSLTSDLATYLSVAGLALVIAVLLEVFTPVRMSVGFAIVFVVVATLATAGVWAVVRWSADVVLGTTFLLEPGVDEAVIERELMFEFLYSTAAGVLAGVVFEVYFRRRAPHEKRIPEAVVERAETAVEASEAPIDASGDGLTGEEETG